MELKLNEQPLFVCSKCKESKNIDEFKKDNKRIHGISSWCKKCHNISSRISAKENKEYNKNRVSEWRKKNYEKYIENNRNWRSVNKEKIRISNKKCKIKNKIKYNETRKNWRKLNPDKVANQYRKYYKNHPEVIQSINKRYKITHIEKVKKADSLRRKRAYRDTHDWVMRQYLKRRGIKLKDATCDLIEIQRIIIKTKRLCKTLENSEKS